MKNDLKQERDTAKRRLIKETVLRHKDHPSAEAIYDDIHSKDNKISRATVYRNLKILADKGEVLHVRSVGADRYDSTIEDHYHILCSKCGAMIDAPIPYHSDYDVMIEDQTGFRIRCHRTLFEGICPACLDMMDQTEKDYIEEGIV